MRIDDIRKSVLDEVLFLLVRVEFIAVRIESVCRVQQKNLVLLRKRPQHLVWLCAFGPQRGWIFYATVAPGSKAARVVLDADRGPFCKPQGDFTRLKHIGKIERHERLEAADVKIPRLCNFFLIPPRHFRRGYRRHRVGHDNGAGESPGDHWCHEL